MLKTNVLYVKGLRLIYSENMLHSSLMKHNIIEYLTKLHFNHNS